MEQVVVLFGVFLFFTVLGMPIAHAMLPAMLVVIILWLQIPIATIAVAIVGGIDQWIWLAFPLFLIVGCLMNESGVADALVGFCQELFGRIPGALSHISVATNVLMAGISGSCTADAAATGSMLIPAMRRAGYPKGFASMIICASSLIGPLIPPSLGLIIVAVLGHLSVLRLWLSGAVPGLTLGLGLLITGYIMAKKKGFPRVERPFSIRRVGSTGLRAAPTLVLPFVILGGMRLGIFTPTEAGATAVVYVLFLGLVVYRKLTFQNYQQAMWNAIELIGSIMWIIGVAIAFGVIVARLNVGGILVAYITSLTGSPVLFLVVISAMLLLVGCVMEGAPILLILYPLFYPVANKYGIDPIHFGLLFYYCVLVGQSTPPVGPTMMVTNAIAECTVGDFLREGWPLLVTQVMMVPLFIFFPSLITWLPNLIMGLRI